MPTNENVLYQNTLPSNNITQDEALYIREVQNRLRELAFKDERIPLISVDGVYGPQTTEAVRAFQEAYGLDPTGKVDKTTWDALYKAYLDITDAERPIAGVVTFPDPNYVIRQGDTGDLVYAVQFMINSVSKVFANVPETLLSGVYDSGTARAVQSIQHAAGLPETGDVDKRTWDMLLGAYIVNRPR